MGVQYAFAFGTDKPLPPSELDADFFQVLQMIGSLVEECQVNGL
jgi:hypothetical protein